MAATGQPDMYRCTRRGYEGCLQRSNRLHSTSPAIRYRPEMRETRGRDTGEQNETRYDEGPADHSTSVRLRETDAEVQQRDGGVGRQELEVLV
jgi:hypothetical protein